MRSAHFVKSALRRLGLVGVLIGSVSVVGALQVGVESASAVSAGKHTICHRTHATTNPYRRITVSVNAIFLGNQDFFKGSGHSVAAHDQSRAGFSPQTDSNGNSINNYFDPDVSYEPTEKKWGDIIPPYLGDEGLNSRDDQLNYADISDGDLTQDGVEDFTGKAIFDGASGYRGLCSKMSAFDFIKAECSSANIGPSKQWSTEADCLDDAFDDLEDQGASEDLPLKEKLGGSFSGWRSDPANSSKNLSQIGSALSDLSFTAQTLQCQIERFDSTEDLLTFAGRYDAQGISSFTYFEWGLESDLSDFDNGDNAGISLFEDGTEVTPLSETDDGFDAALVDNDVLTPMSMEPIQELRGTAVYYRLVLVSEFNDPDSLGGEKISSYTYGSIRRCVRSGGGGGSATTAPATTVGPSETSAPPLKNKPADPKKNDDPRGHKDNGPDDVTKKLSLDPEPNPSDPSKGGKIIIENDPQLPAPEVTSCEVDNPDYECVINYSGPEYNNPTTWQQNGFGDECWKIDPGGYSYTLPDPPQPPSGRTGGTYSVVVVKAGSLTSTDPNFQVNTLFYDPSPNTDVWPDSNKDGIYNPGGRYGDKQISHIIFCVTYGSRSTSSTTAPGSTSPATTSTSTSSPSTSGPGTTSPSSSGPSTSGPGTTSPSSSGPSTSGPGTTSPATTSPSTSGPGSTSPATSSPSTTAPGSNAPTTSTPARPRSPEVEIRPKSGITPLPGLANLKLGVTVGTDEELLIVPIDLTNFIFKNALPELPVTGSDTDTPRSLAVVMVIGGLLLYAVRRRLLIKN